MRMSYMKINFKKKNQQRFWVFLLVISLPGTHKHYRKIHLKTMELFEEISEYAEFVLQKENY